MHATRSTLSNPIQAPRRPLHFTSLRERTEQNRTEKEEGRPWMEKEPRIESQAKPGKAERTAVVDSRTDGGTEESGSALTGSLRGPLPIPLSTHSIQSPAFLRCPPLCLCLCLLLPACDPIPKRPRGKAKALLLFGPFFSLPSFSLLYSESERMREREKEAQRGRCYNEQEAEKEVFGAPFACSKSLLAQFLPTIIPVPPSKPMS